LLQGCGVGIHAEARAKIRLILSDFSDILNSLIIGGPLSRALHCNRTSAMLTLMSNRSTRVDAYIQQAPEFAPPLLEKLRSLFHKASPDIEENIKWGAPTFEYKGIIAGMAAFKNHVGFGFMKSPIMKDPHGILHDKACESIMHLNVRKLSELPTQKVLFPYIREAIEPNERGVKVPPQKSTKTAPGTPAPLLAALKKNKQSLKVFEGFTPAKRRDYVEWITEAKREETRDKRITTAVEWIAEGKSRNWKYEKK
jgi:uncharacterized protein YdeI (YjbR/CyaY-like superfamily)